MNRKIYSYKSFIVSSIVATIFLSLGFAMLHFGWVAYGWAFFVLLPIVTGLSVGAIPNKSSAYFGLMISLIIVFIGIIALGFEGILCGLMSMGIILPFLFLGALIAHLIREFKKINGTLNMSVLMLPLVIFLFFAPLEKPKKHLNRVETEIILPFKPIDVFNTIKSVDTLVVEKSFLMHFGLPVPRKCVLEQEAVGGIRTCYFEGGKIIEKTTKFEPGICLEMVVTDYELTGRKWLTFVDAQYRFEELADSSTKMTRITTYTSELKPRFYWELLEKVGIEQEHDYVFRNLKKDLTNKYLIQ